MDPASPLTLDIEKPVAGGRMLARHDGQIVLVWGGIPGERVAARIDRVAKRVAYATTIDVLTPSADRRADAGDWRCGGNVYAHIHYERQRALKSEIVVDALRRIGHVTLSTSPAVVASPEQGYRMRARLHAKAGRLGFYREETHDLCDAASTGQLLPETVAWLTQVAGDLQAELERVASVEISENMPANERGCYVDFRTGDGRIIGYSTVTDVLHPVAGEPQIAIRLRRSVRAFFQGNRFLLEPLLHHVLSLVPDGPVLDLYAGVGLFGLSIAAARSDDVTLVEGDPVSGSDLRDNAEAFGSRVQVHRVGVEEFLRGIPVKPLAGTGVAVRRNPGEVGSRPDEATLIVDPPRTGMSRDAITSVMSLRPRRVVFVSCDPATLARDVRIFLDAGYELAGLTAFDLFPNTAHIESVALLIRAI